MLATNEVLNVTRRHCAPEVFAVFHKTYYIALGQIDVLESVVCTTVRYIA